jgi:hypothetical protein
MTLAPTLSWFASKPLPEVDTPLKLRPTKSRPSNHPLHLMFEVKVPEIIGEYCMSIFELEKTTGLNICDWCFTTGVDVLRHTASNTYWHKSCADEASTVIHLVGGCKHHAISLKHGIVAGTSVDLQDNQRSDG